VINGGGPCISAPYTTASASAATGRQEAGFAPYLR